MASTSSHLYLQIASRVAQMVASGALQAGQRLPSVRDSAVQNNVSVATVVQAFRHLEEHGVLQPRPKSGYFVAPSSRAKATSLARKLAPDGESQTEPKSDKTKLQVDGAAQRPSVSFAGYSPKDKDFFDVDRIRIALSRATRLKRETLTEYTTSVGTLALRNAVALRALHLGCALKADNIVITSSCIQAIEMCLQVVTKPGDMVAIESPTFFGFLDLLESLGLKALALPTDPRTGVSLPALQLALDTQPIKTLLLVPTLSNPLASVMPLTHKRALARLLAQYKVPLIEDVVFNDLLATDARRRAVKAYDTEGWVMTCGSFAKTVSPGIRLGWVDAGRWSKELATLKRVRGASTNAVLEYALADLLTQGSYEAHLRRLCTLMNQRLGQARKIVQTHFPVGTKVNDPPAGYTLWVQLPEMVDSMRLFEMCKALGITIGPGRLFCASHRYQHYLRLSFAGAWGSKEQAALAEVGRQACQLVNREQVQATSEPLDVTRTDFMSTTSVSAHDLW
jgi:DNA-binding transcriptional MocR family regulator